MAIFDNTRPAPAKPSFAPEPIAAKDAPVTPEFATPEPPVVQRPHAATASSAKESLIAADLTIEGKIEGSGHVRIAGKFKGDVNVQGDLTIENGAKLTGGVKANRVNVAGELDGNIQSASRVELVESGAVNGDIKADTLTVAAGSRIRGHVECGAWGDKGGGKAGARTDSDAA